MATPTNRSVIRTFAILDAFRRLGGQGTAREVARCSGMDQATAHRFIATLEQVGAITRDRCGLFSLGMTLADLGLIVPAQRIILDACEDCLGPVAERLGETLHVGVLQGDMVNYLYKAASCRPAGERTRAGVQLEAYGTALGKMLLAHLPEAALAAYLYDGNFVRLTDTTITEPDALRAELDDVRRKAHAFDFGETYRGVHCVAVPIHSASGTVIAALSCTGSADRLDLERMKAIVPELSAAAGSICTRLYSATL